MTLEGRLEADVSADGRGSNTVSFAFTVTNTGADTVELEFSDAAKAEFIVRHGDRERWRFTEERLFAQMISAERLAPGETATYEAEWVTSRSGDYLALAQLRAREATCEARTTFTVPSS